MKKIHSAIIACSALIGSQFISTAAMAQAADGVYSGLVVVQKGLTLTCTATVTLSNGGTEATITLSPPVDALCSLISFNDGPYNVTWDGNEATVEDVNVTTITPGGCDGDLTVTWDGVDELSVSGTLPPDCSVNGAVYLEP